MKYFPNNDSTLVDTAKQLESKTYTTHTGKNVVVRVIGYDNRSKDYSSNWRRISSGTVNSPSCLSIHVVDPDSKYLDDMYKMQMDSYGHARLALYDTVPYTFIYGIATADRKRGYAGIVLDVALSISKAVGYMACQCTTNGTNKRIDTILSRHGWEPLSTWRNKNSGNTCTTWLRSLENVEC